MIKVSESIIIERPPAEVFEIAADPQNQLKWDPETLKSVEKLTPGPLAQGARYRGNFKGLGLVEYEFTEYEPSRCFAHHAVMVFGDGHHIFEFETVSEGTRLTQSMHVEPKGMGKLMRPFMGVMLRRRLREINFRLRDYLKTH